MRRIIDRKMLLFAAAVAVIASAAWYVAGIVREDHPEITIDPREIGFPGIQLRPGSDKDSFTLVGRARNRSTRFTVTGVTLKVTMEDVPASGAWTTAGTTTIVLKKDIPPGESGFFDEPVLFNDLPPPQGRHEWNYAVVEVTGK